VGCCPCAHDGDPGTNGAALPGADWARLLGLLAMLERAPPWAALCWPLLLLMLSPHVSRRTALRMPFVTLAMQSSGEPSTCSRFAPRACCRR